MNIGHNDNLREKLAAEYVLGTLKHGARRRFESWLVNDAAFRRAVTEWQDRLSPMAEFAPSVLLSPQIWSRIEKTLRLQETTDTGGRPSLGVRLRKNLNFWRGLGLVSTSLATILVAVLVTKQLEPTSSVTSYVATLSNEQSQPVMVITGDERHHQMTVKVLSTLPLAADRSLELWAVPKSGAPRSLGLVAANGSVTLRLPRNMTPASIPLLAISLEPKGGSPNPNSPTGPILFKGAWVQI